MLFAPLARGSYPVPLFSSSQLAATAYSAKSAERERMIPMMLEHVAAAIWGCTTCIHESELSSIVSDLTKCMPDWLPDLRLLTQFNDERVNESVTQAATSSIAMLSFSPAMTSQLLNTYPEMLLQVSTKISNYTKLHGLCRFSRLPNQHLGQRREWQQQAP